MTPAQRAALRSAMERAKPGADSISPLDDVRVTPCTGVDPRRLAEFIAACSPEVIEGLLDDLDAAERARDAAPTTWYTTPTGELRPRICWRCGCGAMNDETDRLAKAESRLAALKAERVALVERAVRAGATAEHATKCSCGGVGGVHVDQLHIIAALAEPDAQGTT